MGSDYLMAMGLPSGVSSGWSSLVAWRLRISVVTAMAQVPYLAQELLHASGTVRKKSSGRPRRGSAVNEPD